MDMKWNSLYIYTHTNHQVGKFVFYFLFYINPILSSICFLMSVDHFILTETTSFSVHQKFSESHRNMAMKPVKYYVVLCVCFIILYVCVVYL